MRLISKIIGNQEKPVSNSGENVALTSNPNLLINPWFTVNQRGLASYTPNNSYTLDRWLSPASSDFTVTVTSNGVTLSSISGNKVFRQKIDYLLYLLGKTVTISLLLADGTIIAGTNICPATDGGEWSVNFGVNSKVRLINFSGLLLFDIVVGSGETINARAVKLEIGSTSTLHLDTAPDYTTELLKCQRYFRRIGSVTNNGLVCFAVIANSTNGYAVIPLSTPMRVNPTFSVSGEYKFASYTFSYYSVTVSLNSASDYRDRLTLNLVGSGLPSATSGFLVCGSTSYMDFSAEL